MIPKKNSDLTSLLLVSDNREFTDICPCCAELRELSLYREALFIFKDNKLTYTMPLQDQTIHTGDFLDVLVPQEFIRKFNKKIAIDENGDPILHPEIILELRNEFASNANAVYCYQPELAEIFNDTKKTERIMRGKILFYHVDSRFFPTADQILMGINPEEYFVIDKPKLIKTNKKIEKPKGFPNISIGDKDFLGSLEGERELNAMICKGACEFCYLSNTEGKNGEITPQTARRIVQKHLKTFAKYIKEYGSPSNLQGHPLDLLETCINCDYKFAYVAERVINKKSD
jgi:hypothetical protein